MKKYLIGFSVFILAFGILSVSLMEVASPKFVFSASPSPSPSNQDSLVNIEYELPYPGKILPDSPLWPFKASRDRLWYTFTFSDQKKAELALLFSNKRLVMSKDLFENEKPDLAFSTLTKAEKYLETAESKGEGNVFLMSLAKATLKHRQVVREILEIAPADAKPEIILLDNKLKNIFNTTKEKLIKEGINAPIDPFNRD